MANHIKTKIEEMKAKLICKVNNSFEIANWWLNRSKDITVNVTVLSQIMAIHMGSRITQWLAKVQFLQMLMRMIRDYFTISPQPKWLEKQF